MEGSRLIFLLAAQGFRVIAISISRQGLSFALPEFCVFEISVFLQQIDSHSEFGGFESLTLPLLQLLKLESLRVFFLC